MWLLLLASLGFAQNYQQNRQQLLVEVDVAVFKGAGERYLEALGGDIDAQFHAGFRALRLGSQRRNERAVTWLKMAAEQGHPFAAWLLADHANRTYPQNQKEVVYWLHRSAELGFPEGQSGLARLYETGKFVDPDLEQAVHWYRRAAAQKQPEACFRLAKILARRPGTDREREHLFRIAAKDGDPRALYELAMMQLRREPKLAADPVFLAVAQYPSDEWRPQYEDAKLLAGDPVRDAATMLKNGSIMGCGSCGAMLGLMFDKGVGGVRRSRIDAYRGYKSFWAESNAELRFQIERIAAKRFRALSEKEKAVFRRPKEYFVNGGFCRLLDSYPLELKPLL